MQTYLHRLSERLSHLPPEVRSRIQSCPCIECIHDVLAKHRAPKRVSIHQRKRVFISRETGLMGKRDLWSQIWRFVAF